MRNRILVWGLTNNLAGTEAVITTYVQASKEIDFDFLCYDEPINHAQLFQDTNNRYFVIPIKIKHPLANRAALNSFMKKHAEEYSALWFNVNEISNIDLLELSYKYGIPRRITHVHNPSFPDVFITKLFSKKNWKRCLQLTTEYWACSREAGKFLFKGREFQVIPNLVNVNMRQFSERKRNVVRSRYQLNESFVIGSVGRLVEQKNFKFLVRILPDLLKVNPKAVLMLVGNGPLADELKHETKQLGITDKVIFAGVQEDIQAFLSCFDVFALPSYYEGLSLSILEAQFNGLPCVLSTGVGDECIISSNATLLPLDDCRPWIECIAAASREENTLIEERAKKYRLENAALLSGEMFNQ